MKIGTKLGGGYLLVLAMVIICSGAGFYGVNKLSGLLDFITGPAWDTADGAMEGSIGIEAQMIGVSQIVSGQANRETAQNMIAKGQVMAEEALGRMVNAGLLSSNEVNLVNTEKQVYRKAQQGLLSAHKKYQQEDQLLRKHFNDFQELMTQAEEIGDSAVESLEQNPDQNITWNSGLSEKWSAADGGMESQIELLTRFYNYQRLVSLMETNSSNEENDIKNKLIQALASLQEKVQEITQHPLFTSTKVSSGVFSGQNFSEAISSAFTQHNSDFVNATQSFYLFRDNNINYQHIADKFLGIIEEIEEAGDSKVEGQMQIVQQTQSTTFILIALATLLSIACVVALIIFVVKDIVHTIEGMSYASQKIADGDLTIEMCQPDQKPSNNELNTLNLNMARMTRGLRETISEVTTTSSLLTSQAEQLSIVSFETRDNVIEQQNRTAQVAAASTEMSASCKEVAQSTAVARDSANQAQNLALEGKTIVGATIAMIESLSTEVATTALVINQLSDDSAKIGNVLDVIRGIAEQTNLLALNAAIEAARAGEQGRGFAVVADEVRSLAQRTQESTQEIQLVIEGLQSRTKEAHDAMNSSQARVSDSTIQASQAETALDNITREVEEIANQNAQIATAMNQQEAAAEEITVSMVDIEDKASHTVVAVNHTSDSSKEVAAQAGNLQQLVAQFTI